MVATITNGNGDSLTLALDSGSQPTSCAGATLVFGGAGHSIGTFPSGPVIPGSWITLLENPSWSGVDETEALTRLYSYLHRQDRGADVYAASVGSSSAYRLIAVINDPVAFETFALDEIVEAVFGEKVLDLDCNDPDWVLSICPYPHPSGLEDAFADWRESDDVPAYRVFEGRSQTLTETDTVLDAEQLDIAIYQGGNVSLDCDMQVFNYSPRNIDAIPSTIRGNPGVVCFGGNSLDDPTVAVAWHEGPFSFSVAVTRTIIRQNRDGSGLTWVLAGSDEFYPYDDLLVAIEQWSLVVGK